MLRKVLATLAGIALMVLGLIGLVLPVLPGLLFLVAAAGCFSIASRRFHSRLQRHIARHPRYHRALRYWRLGRSLPGWARLRLAFWLTVGSLVPDQRR